MPQIEDSANLASVAPETLPPVLIWHDQAAKYRQALIPRLPGVRIDTASGLRASGTLTDARVLLAWRPPEGVLAQLPQLQWIQVTGAGVDAFLAREDLAPDVTMTRSLGRFGEQAAEYVVGYLLSLLLGVEDYRRDQDRAVWRPRSRPLLSDLTVGVVGLGSLGSRIAERIDQFGARVLGSCRGSRPVPRVQQVFANQDWHQMLPQCDALILAAPLTPETRGMLDAPALAALPPHAIVINVGRGALIDEEALLACVRDGKLRAAVLDTLTQEPLPPESPLWSEPRVWITPHVAGPSEIDPIAEEFADNYRRFTRGADLKNLIDRDRGY